MELLEDQLHALGLLDTLEALPLDVVADNVWEDLPTATDCGSLRQACQQSRRLTDLLVTSAVHNLEHFSADGALASWHQSTRVRAAYLARLPRLTSLELHNWCSESQLATVLTRYGDATQGRVTTLSLSGGTATVEPLSSATGCAIRLACPRLTSLSLALPAGAHTGCYLTGDILLPLCGLNITTVRLSISCPLSLDALLSLSSMPHLRELGLSVSFLPPGTLASLSSLVHLKHCDVHQQITTFPIGDIAPLLSHTQLEHLNVSSEFRGSSALAGGAAFRPALPLLSGLVHLRHLGLGHVFVVDDGVWPVLRSLTQLTYLEAGSFQLSHPQPGHLLALRTLILIGSRRPTQLLSALLPLLPLPALERVVTCGQPDALYIDMGAQDRPAAAHQTVAMAQVAVHLAAAPQLVPHMLQLVTTAGAQYPTSLEVVKALHPLRERLETLALNLPLIGADWAVLGSHLPNVPVLQLVRCEVSDSALGAICSAWPQLDELHVRYCTRLTVEGWLGLAAVQGPTLRVVSSPPLPPAWIDQCQRLQVVVWGTESCITWDADEGRP